MLIITGAVLMAAGLVVMLLERGGVLFRMPGDILIERKSFTIYFPIMTSVILSIALTIIFWLIGRGR